VVLASVGPYTSNARQNVNEFSYVDMFVTLFAKIVPLARHSVKTDVNTANAQSHVVSRVCHVRSDVYGNVSISNAQRNAANLAIDHLVINHATQSYDAVIAALGCVASLVQINVESVIMMK